MLSRLTSHRQHRMAGAHRTWQSFALWRFQRTFRPRSVAVFEYQLRPVPRYGWGAPPHGRILDFLRSREAESETVAQTVLSSDSDLFKIPGGRVSGGGLSWDNDWWGGLDAMVLYAMVRERNPARYIEVGSGYSTRFVRRAISDHGLRTEITSIDPQPRAEIDDLCDHAIRSSLEEVDLDLFANLGAGDVVVMDGSHTAFMNSDSVVFFLDVLPSLASGVLVAIDDIFLPWDYPPSWADRWYGEQYLLASMLLSVGDTWSISFPAWYLTQESELRRRFDPLWQHINPIHGRYAMSFWMQKT